MTERCIFVDLLACSRSLVKIPAILTVISVWFSRSISRNMGMFEYNKLQPCLLQIFPSITHKLFDYMGQKV